MARYHFQLHVPGAGEGDDDAPLRWGAGAFASPRALRAACVRAARDLGWAHVAANEAARDVLRYPATYRPF